MTSPKPRVPNGAGPSGQRLWAGVVDDYVLERHELELLKQAVRCVDDLDALDAVVAQDGVVVDGKSGPRVHPALVESRQLRLTLARVLAALRLPSGLAGKSPHLDARRPGPE
jgi:hypothetical protein